MTTSLVRRILLGLLCVVGLLVTADPAAAATTALADSPILATSQVPPNIMLTLSVEWPTGTTAAYNDNYSTVTGLECPGRDGSIGVCYFSTRTYLGYFDPEKCYAYDTTLLYFVSKGTAVSRNCTTITAGRWSGNYLNWVQTHSLDGFRYAMTGGDRYIDTATSGSTQGVTVIEKSIHTGQGGYTQFPIKRVQTADFTGGTPTVPGVTPSTVSPQSWTTMYARVTDDSYALASGSPTRIGRVVQFANNTNFWSAFPSTGLRYFKLQLSGTNNINLAEFQVLQAGTGSWTQCATENNTCTVSSSSEVRFGANGTWTATNTILAAGSSISCNTATFGDPLVGTAKVCQYRVMTNVAKNKTATQSSTDSYTGPASYAVDGNVDGAFGDGSVTETAADAQAWWQVDLGSAVSNILAVIIFNRTDCCADRLQNFYVFGSTTDIHSNTLDQSLASASLWKYQVGAQPNPSTILAPQSTDAATDLLNARVKVCDSTVSLESNCTLYGTTYKPTGVVQNNADKMRFGVVSYLNVDGTNTMGGVLRSGLKYVGPNTIVPNGTPATNSRQEITSTGLLIQDPEGASSGSIVASGVIPYLNKFGKLGTKSTLKSNDTVSELFYEALRYMRASTTSTPQFSNFVGTDAASIAAAGDGFPYYTTWPSTTDLITRPIQYACQKSYFVGIGDTNTWCDSWGPGNSRTSSCSNSGASHNATPPTDAQLSSVMGMDNLLGANEAGTAATSTAGAGLTSGASLGSTWIDSGRSDTFDIAGYAFWANTRDLLVDDNTLPWTVGKQTAQFYWVDVRETGSFNGNPNPKNQYWLAGRYGGFPSSSTVVSTDANQEMPSATYDPLNKNYFTGDRPDTLISSLQTVFKNILAVTQSNASAALTSNNLSTTAGAYLVQYNSSNWTGEVVGETAGFDATTDVFTTSQVWTFAAQLDAQNWDTGRNIVTYNTTTKLGAPFRPATITLGSQMSSAQFLYFGSTTSAQTDLINYLRGNTTYESGTGAKYRPRVHQLGDIVDAAPVIVGPPAETYTEANNPGYSTHASTYASRIPVLFVGSNDGMLHAIDGRVTNMASPPAAELFAYIPSLVLSGPSSPATPTVDGIASRANTTLLHKYLVDGQVNSRNVDFGKTGGTTSSTRDWRTLLVGGLGKGGRGIYALDVTNPASWTSETAVAGKVLWEYTDADMGYSYGTPLIFKTAQWGWVVAVSSGYNNTGTSQTGTGWIAILNAKTGALIQKISTGAGSTTAPAGLARFEAFIPDRTDFTADSLYAGDLLGNLWRFDLTTASGNYPAPTKLITLKDAAGNLQPVTSAPAIGVTNSTLQRWVLIGTGKLLDSTDISSTAQQTFYAIHDGTQAAFSTAPLDGSSFPMTGARATTGAQLQAEADSDLLTGITVGTTQNGWYHDFSGTGTSGATERLVSNIDTQQGLVAFATQIPSTDPCNPGVSSRVYAINYATGKSALIDSGNATLSYAATSTATFGVTLVTDAVGNTGIVTSTTTPALTPGPAVANAGLNPIVKINWREILQ